ncbi:AAA family ATPase [Rhodoplanes sp. TEM]|uniref:AAA family ATPase n=1 Tax=Rhodoplanes tepidamans TaxID=200616 RepID=A0ABT5JG41_RHOTP|nr:MULTISPECIES: AAA family ATPase [Rhodoplanes]MDC7788576.1 AAA family ATPase [Rhodoplanes tepidamans]MDC7986794.1 AAA family ATPase [Rhodoplanes sp. TEM]MDQ0358558.1 tetratricopeptide (TPR) repeat protein [Rhodoplanes tepidamans]
MALLETTTTTRPEPVGFDPEEVGAVLSRTIASPEFVASPRMATLLAFLVGEWLAGREKSIKEYGIALSVFGKDASFDPSSNAVVRVEAGRLRRLLAEYARGSGAGQPAVLHIPKGCYVPRLVHPSHGGTTRCEPAPAATSPCRHHVTVVSCGLCSDDGSGPGDSIHEAFPAFREHCARITEAFGGRLAEEGADRFVAFFGWPQSLEHAAHRGVMAAMEIVTALNDHPVLSGAAARAGVATGWAVSGSIGGSPNRVAPALLGDVVGMATTIFSHAPPRGVLVSDATRRLTPRICQTETAAMQLASGGTAWRVTAVSPLGDVLPHIGASPLIGRQHELGLLRGRWSRVVAREGQVAVVTGEPGIGKSRLVQELWATIESQAAERWLLRALPTDRGCSFAPIRKRVAEAASIGKDDDTPAILDKLAALLRRADETDALAQPLLESLFGLPEDGRLADLPARQRKDLTLALLVRLTLGAARRGPLLLVVEDAHWLDPSTREFVHLLARTIATAPVFLVVTTRPEAEACIRRLPRATVLELAPLGNSDAEHLIDEIVGPGAITPDCRGSIVEKAEGIPLFIEELARTVVAPGTPPDGVPGSLIDLFMARLDRLGDNRLLAQMASVIGRDFQGDFLAALLDVPSATFATAIRQLIEDEILLPVVDDCNGFLCFRHILLRDAAYESILPQQRRAFHERIARALSTRTRFAVDRRPEFIASHFDKADRPHESAPLWFEAGQAAMRVFANEEAQHHLEAGLKALDRIPAAERPKRLEADILTALGVVIRITKGYGASGLYPLYKRARTLCREFGTREQEAAAFAGCWTYLAGRGKWEEATDLARNCANNAARARNANLLLEARRMIGTSALYQGRLVTARAWLDKVLLRYDIRRYKPSHGYDAGVAAAAYSAWALWLQGDETAATAAASRALTTAAAQNHAPSQAMALGWHVILDILRGAIDSAAEHGGQLRKLSDEHGFAHWRPLGDFGVAWHALLRLGDRAALATMSSAIDDFRRLWGGFLSPILWITMAQGHLGGDHERGLAAIDAAWSFSASQSEHLWDAEILRVSGEFALAEATPNYDSAIRHFRQAISVARAQDAVALERRAAARLAEVEACRAGEAAPLLKRTA